MFFLFLLFFCQLILLLWIIQILGRWMYFNIRVDEFQEIFRRGLEILLPFARVPLAFPSTSPRVAIVASLTVSLGALLYLLLS